MGKSTDQACAAQLMAYFVVNPDEELRFEDIATKLGTSLWYARQVVRKLKRDGKLDVVRVVRRPRA